MQCFISLHFKYPKLYLQTGFPTYPQTMNRTDTQALGGTVNARIGKVYMNLSKAHKKAADYVLSNVFRSATMSIDELANAVGISVATANRFARALGFEGYPQFRAELVSGFEAMLVPIDNLRNEVQRPATPAEIIAGTLNEDIANLEAGRIGDRIGDQIAAFGDARHATARGVELVAIAARQNGQRVGMFGQGHAEGGRHGVGGYVVMGRTDSAGREHIGVAHAALVDRLDDVGFRQIDDLSMVTREQVEPTRAIFVRREG